MWKQLFDWFKWVLSLAQEERKNSAAIKELDQKIQKLAAVMQLLTNYDPGKINELSWSDTCAHSNESALAIFTPALTRICGHAESGLGADFGSPTNKTLHTTAIQRRVEVGR